MHCIAVGLTSVICAIFTIGGHRVATMPNKCQLDYCQTGQKPNTDGKKISTFKFSLDDPEICEKWVYFVGESGWKPSKYSTICEHHFDPKYIKFGAERNKLKYSLKPVLTIHKNDDSLPLSTLRVPTVPRPAPAQRNITPDEKPAFNSKDRIKSLNCLSATNCPSGWSFRRHQDKVVMYNLQFDYVTSIPVVFESIVVDEKLHVSLSYKGDHVPLPPWFRDNRCKLDRFSILENLPSYIRAKANETNDILEELNAIKHLQPQGRPPYSARVIRWALLLRHTSPQAYRLFLEKFPAPSFALLKRIQRGGLDAIKAITLLFQKDAISKDCVLLIDEMILQKASQYHSGNMIGADADGNLYKGIVNFMIVGLQKSIPYVVKSSPEITITWEWLWKEVDKCITTLAEAGFNVRAVIADDHSSNVAAYKKLHEVYHGDSETYIFHPAYGGIQKTYLFFDIVHIIKNVRNNLLNKKKFVYPKFSFNKFEDPIQVSDGYVDWRLFHQVYERDQKLQANLRKAPKLTYRTLHPGKKSKIGFIRIFRRKKKTKNWFS